MEQGAGVVLGGYFNNIQELSHIEFSVMTRHLRRHTLPVYRTALPAAASVGETLCRALTALLLTSRCAIYQSIGNNMKLTHTHAHCRGGVRPGFDSTLRC